jgi:predicted TIM-barrel fold metal-dependent hydrolase
MVWSIGIVDEQIVPAACAARLQQLRTPTSCDGNPHHSAGVLESIGCMELTGPGAARLKIMDEEEITAQVIYPTLFLAYPLSSNPAFVTALCSSYNRWLGDWLSGHERLKWAAVVNLDDAKAAAHEVREVKRLGAAAVMVLGTAGDRQLDDPLLFRFMKRWRARICPSPSMSAGPVRRSIISTPISIPPA